MIALIGIEKIAGRNTQKVPGSRVRQMKTSVSNPVSVAPNPMSPNVTKIPHNTPAVPPVQDYAKSGKSAIQGPVQGPMNGPTGKGMPIGIVHPDHVAMRGIAPTPVINEAGRASKFMRSATNAISKFPGGKIGAAVGGAALLGGYALGRSGNNQTIINNR